MNQPRQRFWMVWNPGGNQPRQVHATQALATEEAERLARKQPGIEFIVLMAVAGRCVENMVKTEYKPC